MALDPSTGWSYYKTITIADPSSQSEDCQIMFHIQSGQGTDSGIFRSGGTIYCEKSSSNWPCDIRFGCGAVGTATATELPQWFEASSSTDARVWVRMPTDGTDTIRMYVGNTSAEFYSSGHAVWQFFDDYHYDSSTEYTQQIDSGGDGKSYYGYWRNGYSSNRMRFRTRFYLSGTTDDDYGNRINHGIYNYKGNLDNRDSETQQQLGSDTQDGATATSPDISAFGRKDNVAGALYSKQPSKITEGNTYITNINWHSGQIIQTRTIDSSYNSNIYGSTTTFGIIPIDRLWLVQLAGYSYGSAGNSNYVFIVWNESSNSIKSRLVHYSERNGDGIVCCEYDYIAVGGWSYYKLSSSSISDGFSNAETGGANPIEVSHSSGALNIENIIPSATLTGKVTQSSGNCWIYWGTANGSNDKTAWESSGSIGLKYENNYFTSSVSLLKKTGYNLSGGTTYYYKVYGSSNGWGGGELGLMM